MNSRQVKKTGSDTVKMQESWGCEQKITSVWNGLDPDMNLAIYAVNNIIFKRKVMFVRILLL